MSTRLLVAVSAAVILVGGPAGGAPRPPEVTCGACIVVDEGDRVLFARRPDARLPMASTTKMVTALLVVDRAGLADTVSVSAAAAATGGGGLGLEAGETYTVEGLLYALLLSSSNDAAVALAEHVEGSEAVFVSDMNEYAAELGAERTAFVTAHGLDEPGHYSTARDLATIAAAVVEHPALAEIVATPATTIPGRGGSIAVVNRNALLESYRGAVGVKTGYTLGAGNVLVGAAHRRGRLLISVAMDSADATADTRLLLDYGFARLARTVLLRAGAVVGGFIAIDGSGTAVVADGTVRGPYERSDVEFVLEPAPGRGGVVRGERMGDVVVVHRGRPVGRVAAVAARDVASDGGTPWIVDALLAMVGGVAGLMGRS
ncbi:MAG: D-alanyl-D-alanine carboxypeptidase family protein [Actinomycetota bacterium]